MYILNTLVVSVVVTGRNHVLKVKIYKQKIFILAKYINVYKIVYIEVNNKITLAK